MIVFNLSTIWDDSGADYYWVLFRLMGSWRYWLVSLLTTIIALFIPLTVKSYRELQHYRLDIKNREATSSQNNNTTDNTDSPIDNGE